MRHSAFTLMILCCAITALAGVDTEHCLGVRSLRGKLTFYYTRQDESDKPYFYIKAAAEEIDGNVTLETIRGIAGHLAYVPATLPHQYQGAGDAKQLYIVKSKARLEGFDDITRVVPAIRGDERDIVDLPIKKKRNVTNYPQPLPPETKSAPIADGQISICVFKF